MLHVHPEAQMVVAGDEEPELALLPFGWFPHEECLEMKLGSSWCRDGDVVKVSDMSDIPLVRREALHL